MSLFIPAKGMEPKVAETVDGPPDEPGEEMSREARVWKTYVREADQSDKEMVTGRTRFIIESAKDLKPDYAESSAKTQIYITKMLAAIANGEPVPPPMEEEEFSPSLVAVAVNFLWFLSLSLSLVISLIAMLSKDWCYKFMSGRSGQTYEQAQLRQQKWNGIERWRMTEGMDYMPAGMHLALCKRRPVI
ncbi:hypothetical protein FRC07_011712 [Ceratobasidium sp. 392]|nr:hypothetical protein FRC07_011712 [Ceratobasidium sp. 392]